MARVFQQTNQIHQIHISWVSKIYIVFVVFSVFPLQGFDPHPLMFGTHEGLINDILADLRGCPYDRAQAAATRKRRLFVSFKEVVF